MRINQKSPEVGAFEVLLCRGLVCNAQVPDALLVLALEQPVHSLA